MDPANKEGSGASAPLPLPEQPAIEAVAAAHADKLEQAGGAELAPTPSTAPAAALPATTIPLPVPLPATDVPAISDAPAPAVSSSALPADDGDLIEKEWVNKAKQIVERTRNDPHKQSEDLTLFKADYMQKRYGKNIKVNR